MIFGAGFLLLTVLSSLLGAKQKQKKAHRLVLLLVSDDERLRVAAPSGRMNGMCR